MNSVPPVEAGWFMPAEHHAHERCWMAWPARRDIWGRHLDPLRENVAVVAKAIAQFEPVHMCVRPEQKAGAARLCGPAIHFFEALADDMWTRDTGPSFLVRPKGGVSGSTWNFNGWGNKQVHPNDARLAGRILEDVEVRRFDAPIITEGGALEVDGEGTLICTETSILNPNRNPGMSKEKATEILKGWLGVEKVIWLPDAKPDFWTDGHIDGYVKFVRPGVVLFELSRNRDEADYHSLYEMLRALELSTDARGRKFEIIKLYRPMEFHSTNPNFCDCYINFYLPNGGAVIAKYGDPDSDLLARDTIAQAFPNRHIVQVDVSAIAVGGGSIHCITQQEPVPL